VAVRQQLERGHAAVACNKSVLPIVVWIAADDQRLQQPVALDGCREFFDVDESTARVARGIDRNRLEWNSQNRASFDR